MKIIISNDSGLPIYEQIKNQINDTKLKIDLKKFVKIGALASRP